MATKENLITSVLFFIGLLITLLMPLSIKEEYRLFIISLIIMIFLYIILSKYEEKLDYIETEIRDLSKRFKTMEELDDIRLNIRELQREVLKNV
ncbi:MAG: hypothetical protein AABX54_02035 [Nanoarchaeota archaeon]